MTKKRPTPVRSKFVYFTELILENVKSFSERQTLSLTRADGVLSQWTLIVGENGVGKTTLLQCLANMRPVPNERPVGEDETGEVRKVADAAFYHESENEAVNALVRNGSDVTLFLEASLTVGSLLNATVAPDALAIETGLTATRSKNQLKQVSWDATEVSKFAEPLVIGYGASRHMGHSNFQQASGIGAVESLFSPTAELYDAEEILQQLDYARLKKAKQAKSRLDDLKKVLAAILPDVQSPKNIEIYGPKAFGTVDKTGVHVRTPYGLVPFSALSLGYQTASAWTIDLAWRLFQHYPESSNPLTEPAVVLIDEIDLHLHPRWQRQIRQQLTHHFPNVQFIATAHSPLMAQTYLDENLAVVVRAEDHATVINEPVVVRNWRLDQVVTSELFGLDSARSVEIQDKISRRLALIRKKKKTAAEKAELEKLDSEIEALPVSEGQSDNEAMEIIRRAAEALRKPPQ